MLYDQFSQNKLKAKMQSIIGSLTWLFTSTRPDIATITNILAKYINQPSKGHIEGAKQVVRYLQGMRKYGIAFTSPHTSKIKSFIKFSYKPKSITTLTDANWGPQDQSKVKPGQTPPELETLKSRSISGYIIWYGGPIHWISKSHAITARSSAEAEIYAMDKCVKFLQYLTNIIKDLDLLNTLLPRLIEIYSDNAACVNWSKNMTTKGLRHIQMIENAVREQIRNKLVDILHIPGIQHLSDMFTKEDKDDKHFIECWNTSMQMTP